MSYKELTGPLSYDGELTVVRGAGDGEPVVAWQPSVVHPELKDGDRLVTGEAGTPPVKALDRDGGELTTDTYPSLGLVLDGLREKYGEKAGGEAGVELRIVRGEESEKAKLSDTTVLELSEGTPGTVKTTLNPSCRPPPRRRWRRRTGRRSWCCARRPARYSPWPTPRTASTPRSRVRWRRAPP
ncbi:hypothetical protein SHKM778_86540 [Streptomyces sp. KM77-8]|uniref:Uncharacterized protein n=1 Tax=Streptomyces haneummycinicus TaxID=3074435 RepID=A0AAT9HXT3_9ACTN